MRIFKKYYYNMDNRKKIMVAGYIFQNFVSSDDLDKIENTRLMKLLYLVNFTYMIQNTHYDSFDKTPFEGFKYTAFENGPVERFVYSYIYDIRSALKHGFRFDKVSDVLSAEISSLNAAIAQVQETFGQRDTKWLVDFTHCMLTEWSRTTLSEEMTFSSGGYRTECRALEAYYNYYNGETK